VILSVAIGKKFRYNNSMPTVHEKVYDLKVSDVAEITGYCSQHVRRLTRAGAIPSVKRGRSWIYNLQDVEAACFTFKR
jgi:hypothetical protein